MSSSSEIHVLAICGSLRQHSFNAALLRCAQRQAPAGMHFDYASLHAIPLYNDDVFEHGLPEAVQTLRTQIAQADALLFATPEYNYSIPGVLKNAIDWTSRGKDQPYANKPAAIMGASAGRFATARAQYHLRQILVFLNVHTMNQPEIMIPTAQNLISEDGELMDEATANYVRKQMLALQAWTRQIRQN